MIIIWSAQTKSDLIKAQAAIYVNQGVESAFVLDVEKCASHVAGLTASMAALPFKHPPSRLSCVRKLKVSFNIYIYLISNVL